MSDGREDLYAVVRWARAVERQSARVVAARAPLISDDPIDRATMAEAWTWPDEAHFLLIAANHLRARIERLGWAADYSVDWEHLTHLRNAWEHNDDRNRYQPQYGAPHHLAAWMGDGPGLLGRVDLDRVVIAARQCRLRALAALDDA